MLLPYPIYYDAAFVIGALLASLVVNFLALLIDGIHPKINWEDETKCYQEQLKCCIRVSSKLGHRGHPLCSILLI